ncbi:MAG: class I SAM-dependent methyltransferase [Acidobacteriota bacterium]
MKRVLEPELMDDDAQARAYAEADFEDSNNLFMTLFRDRFVNRPVTGHVIDLGCGPGDISLRFAVAYPNCIVHAVDGAEAMLRHARAALARADTLRERVQFTLARIPEAPLPRASYDVLISNSMLHHLQDPQELWSTIRQHAEAGAPICIMDLKRPGHRQRARALVETYAANEAEILKRDFYNSLLAAFEPDEIRAQLCEAGLHGLAVSEVSDRHLLVAGLLNRP